MDLIKRILKVTHWFIFLVLFGLLQVWIAIFIRWVTHVELGLNNLLLDGYFLFFTISILASYVIELCLKFEDINNSFEVFLFLIYPIIVILFSVIIYLITFFKKDTIDTNLIVQIHYGIYTMAIVYALGYRYNNISKTNQ